MKNINADRNPNAQPRSKPDPIESPFNINQIETLMLSREPSISQCIVAPPYTKKKINEFSLKLLQEIL